MSVVEPHAAHGKHVKYTYLSDDIHEVIFNEASMCAIDEWIYICEYTVSQTASIGLVRQLIDLRVGLPSSVYAIRQVHGLMLRCPGAPPSRVAVLHTRRTTGVTEVFIKLLNLLPDEQARLQIRYFTENERDAAIAWLLIDPDKALR